MTWLSDLLAALMEVAEREQSEVSRRLQRQVSARVNSQRQTRRRVRVVGGERVTG